MTGWQIDHPKSCSVPFAAFASSLDVGLSLRNLPIWRGKTAVGKAKKMAVLPLGNDDILTSVLESSVQWKRMQ